MIEKIKEFEKEAKQKGASVYVSFPCFDEISYNMSKEKVLNVEKVLNAYNFQIMGNAEQNIMPREFMFNSTYHLSKEGVDRRTALFIEDYNQATKN